MQLAAIIARAPVVRCRSAGRHPGAVELTELPAWGISLRGTARRLYGRTAALPRPNTHTTACTCDEGAGRLHAYSSLTRRSRLTWSTWASLAHSTSSQDAGCSALPKHLRNITSNVLVAVSTAARVPKIWITSRRRCSGACRSSGGSGFRSHGDSGRTEPVRCGDAHRSNVDAARACAAHGGIGSGRRMKSHTGGIPLARQRWRSARNGTVPRPVVGRWFGRLPSSCGR